jgi:hypothetical protein
MMGLVRSGIEQRLNRLLPNAARTLDFVTSASCQLFQSRLLFENLTISAKNLPGSYSRAANSCEGEGYLARGNRRARLGECAIETLS